MTTRLPTALDDMPTLALFIDVVQAGSFSRAATKRGLTTSAVSKRIAQLEAKVGLQLLARTTRRLSVTDAGRRLLTRAEHVLAALADTEQELSELAKAPRGVLRVATSVSLGQSHVGRLVAAFAAQHADVAIELAVDEQVIDLVAGGFDVAVRCGTPRDSSLTMRKIAESSRLLCAAPSYLARRGRPAKPEDLARHVCLRHVLEDAGRVWRLGVEQPVEVRVGGTFHTNHTFILRDAAVAGAGIAFLPSFVIADDVKAGRLEVLLESLASELGWIYLAFPAARPSRLARAFGDYVAAALKDAVA